MRRAPFAVLVVPYAVEIDGEVAYAVFRDRSAPSATWSALTGEGARGETPLDAARRQAWRAAGVAPDAAFLALDSRATFDTADGMCEIAEYAFAVRVCRDEVLPSGHELDRHWASYEIANGLLGCGADRNALWELRRRLGHPAVCG